MNKKIQGIIIGGVVVAALGGTLAFLELTGGVKDSSSAEDTSSAVVASEAEPDPVPIITTEEDNIISVAVQNETGGYTLERPESGKTALNIKELTGLNQSTVMKQGIIKDLAKLEAYKLVEENASDLGKYGLAEPNTVFKINFKDGTSRTFKVGDKATKNRYRYVCEEGRSEVYMILESVLSDMIERKEDFVMTSLIPASTATEDTPYGRLTVNRKDLDYEMAFEDLQDDSKALISSQVMVEPIYAHLNIQLSSKVTHGLWGLAAARCEKIFPDENDMKTYGLDDPFAVVYYKNETEEYTLKIGKEIHSTDSNGEDLDEIAAYYCYVEGVSGADCIWQIDAANLPWATYTAGDVISLMTTNKIFDINEVKVTYKGEVSDYTLDGSEEETKVYWVKKNGQDVDVSKFQDLYKYILYFPTKDIYFDEIKGDPFLTIDISRKDGGGDKVEFFEDTSRRVLVKVNGRPSYRLESRWTDVFVENMERLDRGEELKEIP